jgi:hypothetical protein
MMNGDTRAILVSVAVIVVVLVTFLNVNYCRRH